jgi:hypothetical protein
MSDESKSFSKKAIVAIMAAVGLGLLGRTRETSIEDVLKTNDQAKLAVFAIGARNEQVQLAAVERLSDQAQLRRVVVEAKIAPKVKDSDAVARAALEKISDEALLKQIVLQAGIDMQRLAISKLTDTAFLTDVVYDSYTPKNAQQVGSRGRTAFERFAQLVLSGEVPLAEADRRVRNLALFTRAFNQLSEKDRIMHVVSPLVSVLDLLSQPEVEAETGRLSSIRLTCELLERPYTNCTVRGERLECAIVTEKLGTLQGVWQTQFPPTITVDVSSLYVHIPASVDSELATLLHPLTAKLPADYVSKARHLHPDSRIRRALAK